MSSLTELRGWKHKGGTSCRSNCVCETWISHYEAVSNNQPKICSVKDCAKEAEVGMHVYHDDVSGEKILPGCRKCHGEVNDPFDIKAGIDDVSANIQETYKKCMTPTQLENYREFRRLIFRR